jgi:hypothetical protein
VIEGLLAPGRVLASSAAIVFAYDGRINGRLWLDAARARRRWSHTRRG